MTTPAQTVDEIRAGLEGVTRDEDAVNRIAKWMYEADDEDGCSIAWSRPDNAKVRASMRRQVRDVLSALSANIAHTPLPDRLRERIAALEAERDEANEARNHQVFLRMAAEADLAEARKVLGRICAKAKRRDLHGNGALDDVIEPYLINEARAFLAKEK
jgi:hypothetical protein